jgi:hypothetical protein
MKPGDRPGLDLRVAQDLAALARADAAAVPPRLEEELVSAFRLHHALGELRRNDEIPPPYLEARLVSAFHETSQDRAGRRARASVAAAPDALATAAHRWYLTRAAVVLAAVAGGVWFGVMRQPQDAGSTAAPWVAATERAPARTQSPPARAGRARGSGASASRGDAATPARLQTTPRPLAGSPLAAANVMAAAPALDDEPGETGTAERSDDAGFIPIAYGAPLPGEAVHVVSVDVPRSAFVELDEDAVPDASAVVRTEILMSEDGMPRGIRFVNRPPQAAVQPLPSGSRPFER